MTNFLTHTDCLFTPMKTVAFASGFKENVLAKNKSALWFKSLCKSSATCQNSRSKLDLRPDWLFIPLKLSLFKARCQKLHFTGVKQGSEGYGECSNDETHPTAELSNVKNGILRPQGLHPGSICLEGGWSRWLKSALREARCNQAFKMRMTIFTLVDWGCLAASLSAGHHQERLLGWPLRPYCGFKFFFEGVVVSSCFLMKQLIHQLPGLNVALKVQFYCSFFFFSFSWLCWPH